MSDEKVSVDDLEIVDEERVSQRQIVRHALWSKKVSTLLAVAVIVAYASVGAIVLVVSFLHNQDPPSWATAVESSSITAALAVVFKDHIPG